MKVSDKMKTAYASMKEGKATGKKMASPKEIVPNWENWLKSQNIKFDNNDMWTQPGTGKKYSKDDIMQTFKQYGNQNKALTVDGKESDNNIVNSIAYVKVMNGKKNVFLKDATPNSEFDKAKTGLNYSIKPDTQGRSNMSMEDMVSKMEENVAEMPSETEKQTVITPTETQKQTGSAIPLVNDITIYKKQKIKGGQGKDKSREITNKELMKNKSGAGKSYLKGQKKYY